MSSLSVIIPSYNHEAYLAETIQSVLGQTLPPDEVLVVDDGSPDRSAEIARGFGAPVLCIQQENQGLGGSRNTGVRQARGDLIAFLDSDDLWDVRKLELQAAYLAAHPETDMVFCHMRNFLSPELDPSDVPKFDARELPACNTSSLLVRRAVFDANGLFPMERDKQEFFLWFTRACDSGAKYHVLPELLLLRRVHRTNTVRDSGYKERYFRFLKQRLDRARGQDSHPG